jgi:hypothetical protein
MLFSSFESFRFSSVPHCLSRNQGSCPEKKPRCQLWNNVTTQFVIADFEFPLKRLIDVISFEAIEPTNSGRKRWNTSNREINWTGRHETSQFSELSLKIVGRLPQGPTPLRPAGNRSRWSLKSISFPSQQSRISLSLRQIQSLLTVENITITVEQIKPFAGLSNGRHKIR